MGIDPTGDVRLRIAELEDTISCLEHDEELGEDVSAEIDEVFCELADLRDELRELENALD